MLSLFRERYLLTGKQTEYSMCVMHPLESHAFLPSWGMGNTYVWQNLLESQNYRVQCAMILCFPICGRMRRNNIVKVCAECQPKHYFKSWWLISSSHTILFVDWRARASITWYHSRASGYTLVSYPDHVYRLHYDLTQRDLGTRLTIQWSLLGPQLDSSLSSPQLSSPSHTSYPDTQTPLLHSNWKTVQLPAVGSKCVHRVTLVRGLVPYLCRIGSRHLRLRSWWIHHRPSRSFRSDIGHFCIRTECRNRARTLLEEKKKQKKNEPIS